MQGIIVNILSEQQPLNDGITQYPESGGYILIGSGPFEPSERYPALLLKKKIVAGEEYFYCVPADEENAPCICATGKFVTTSDSRFPNRYPLPLHRSQPHLF